MKAHEILRTRELRLEISEAQWQVSETRQRTRVLVQKLLAKLDAFSATWQRQPPPDP